jgi:uncharacterized delta-60 repeat protein
MDSDGIVETNISSSYEYGRAIEMQADGQLVAAGFAGIVVSTKGKKVTTQQDGVLVRYNSDGSLDSSLGGDGIQTTDLGSTGDGFWDLEIQGDQKIVAGGYATVNTRRQMAVVRYRPDGSLDTSFDGDGKAFTAFAGTGGATGYAAAIQSDQKILIAGIANNLIFGVARFNSNGSLDTSFGGTGHVVTNFGLPQFAPNGSTIRYEVTALAIQSDGKIIAAGGGAGYFLMARYNPDGTLDSSFDGDGKVVQDVSASSSWGLIGDIAIQPDGRIVAVGGHLFTAQGIVGRYNPDGSLDSSFGNGGLVQHPQFTGTIGEVELQSDGKIVVSGLQDWRVARLNADGSLDTSFAGAGSVVVTSVGDGASLLIQPNDPNVADDDKIVTIGFGDNANNFIVARLNNDGTFDATWGGAAAASASTSTETAIAPAPASGDSSISALDAASIQQLLAEPEANNTWTRKSRFKLLAL